MKEPAPVFKGFLIGISVYLLWLISLLFLLNQSVTEFSWWIIPAIFLQAHLYTGLFITAHDGMHGTISPNKKLNNFVGLMCTASYALFSFKKLNVAHHKHHDHVGEDEDPDVHRKALIPWYFTFMFNYLSIMQLVGMAILFNALNIVFELPNLILFWVVPAFLSTFQLFYFGTYVPHKGAPENKHKSTTLPKNHFIAFITCYFFGYHYEHHDHPGVPWWKLYKYKA